MTEFIPRSRPCLGAEETQAVRRVIASGHLACGPEVAALESELAAFLDRPVAVVSSGTAALHLALMALGVRSGDRVATPTHCCPSVLYPLRYIGAEPVLFDSGVLGAGTDPDRFRDACRSARVVIAVHTYGFPSGIPDGLGIPVIEDCAHALGARFAGRPAGIAGDAAVFSFYPTKMLAGGECGAVAGPVDLVDRVRRLRSPRGADDGDTRYPYSPSDLPAAVVRAQLTKLDRFLADRRTAAADYRRLLKDLDVILPVERPGTVSSWYRFVIETPRKRDELISAAHRDGIGLGAGVLTPLHRLTGADPARFPGSERAFHRCVSVPVYPGMPTDTPARVADFLAGLVPRGTAREHAL